MTNSIDLFVLKNDQILVRIEASFNVGANLKDLTPIQSDVLFSVINSLVEVRETVGFETACRGHCEKKSFVGQPFSSLRIKRCLCVTAMRRSDDDRSRSSDAFQFVQPRELVVLIQMRKYRDGINKIKLFR